MLPIVFAAALAVAQNVSLSADISHPLPPVPPNVPASFLARDDSGSGVFESFTGTHNAAWLAERFSETSWQSDNALRALNGNSPRTLDEYKKSNEYATAKQMLNMVGRWKSGNKTHTWVFDAAGPQGGMPLRALELEDSPVLPDIGFVPSCIAMMNRTRVLFSTKISPNCWRRSRRMQQVILRCANGATVSSTKNAPNVP